MTPMSTRPGLPVEERLTVDDRLGLVTFELDEEPFIEVDTDICKRCKPKPCLYVCPSAVYTLDGDELVYNIEGCIELGACSVVCHKIGEGAISWSYPRGGKGAAFKFG